MFWATPLEEPGSRRYTGVTEDRSMTTGALLRNVQRARLTFLFPTSTVDVRGKRAHEGQVAVTLGVVEPVPDHELVRDVESDVTNVDLGFGRFGLAQQRADLQRGRPTRLQVAHQ